MGNGVATPDLPDSGLLKALQGVTEEQCMCNQRRDAGRFVGEQFPRRHLQGSPGTRHIIHKNNLAACVVTVRQCNAYIPITQPLFSCDTVVQMVAFGDGGDPLYRFLVRPDQQGVVPRSLAFFGRAAGCRKPFPGPCSGSDPLAAGGNSGPAARHGGHGHPTAQQGT